MYYLPLVWNGGNTQTWEKNALTLAANQLLTSVNSALRLKRRAIDMYDDEVDPMREELEAVRMYDENEDTSPSRAHGEHR